MNMCELLGMTSNLPATLSFSLKKLAEHGGPPTSMRDGWGIGYYEGADVRLIKDAEPADKSDWVRFIESHDLRSSTIMAHIRKATMGEPAYRNTQPFTRELSGRMHLFAHNGWLPGIRDKSQFHSAQFAPIGETDSEKAFCALLDRMWNIKETLGGIPSLAARFLVVSAFAEELRSLGPANFLYSDGDALFAHGDRRKQASTGKVEPPGLVFLQRLCRRGEPAFEANGVSVEATDQIITLIASVPLSDGPWRPIVEGEVIAFSKGKILSRSLGATSL
jgi:predicted glutamine amidotransferase